MSELQPAQADPLAEGFRDPPDRVTEPCLTYMARVMELRDFVSFYFSFVKRSRELGLLIPAAAKATANPELLEVLEYSYSNQRP